MRAGTRLYRNIEIPANAKVETNAKDKEFYISGIGERTASIYLFDEMKFEQMYLTDLKKYL